MPLTQVSSKGIKNGTILDEDISGSAAIQASKVSGLATDSITEGVAKVETVRIQNLPASGDTTDEINMTVGMQDADSNPSNALTQIAGTIDGHGRWYIGPRSGGRSNAPDHLVDGSALTISGSFSRDSNVAGSYESYACLHLNNASPQSASALGKIYFSGYGNGFEGASIIGIPTGGWGNYPNFRATDISINLNSYGVNSSTDTSLVERWRFKASGALAVNGISNIGTAGQVLTSQGDQPPTWTTINAASDLVDDTSPQLGGDLASNGHDIKLADGDKIILGTGNDLEIYHNVSDTSSYVTHENGTGYLYLQADAIKLRTNSGTGNETYISCNHNTSVDLYWNNVKKFVTTEYGAAVTNTSTPLTNANSNANDFVISGGGASGMTIHSTSTNQNTSIYFSDADSTTIGAIIYKHSNNQMRFNVDGGLGIQLNPDKTVYFQNTIYASGFSTGSDLTHKSNLVRFTDTLNKLKQIFGYKFDMKVGEFKDATISSAGIIAQDVEKVFPELVEGEEGGKTVQYNGLIGVLIEAVNELSTKVAALEAA